MEHPPRLDCDCRWCLMVFGQEESDDEAREGGYNPERQRLEQYRIELIHAQLDEIERQLATERINERRAAEEQQHSQAEQVNEFGVPQRPIESSFISATEQMRATRERRRIVMVTNRGTQTDD